MSFLLIKIVSNRCENLIFHLHFYHRDIAVSNKDKGLKFSGIVLHGSPEGKLSQNFDLGPSLYLILCRKVTRFLS